MFWDKCFTHVNIFEHFLTVPDLNSAHFSHFCGQYPRECNCKFQIYLSADLATKSETSSWRISLAYRWFCSWSNLVMIDVRSLQRSSSSWAASSNEAIAQYRDGETTIFLVSSVFSLLVVSSHSDGVFPPLPYKDAYFHFVFWLSNDFMSK